MAENNEASLAELEMRELYQQIDIREGSRSCEIRHPVYGGNLTVYRPERDRLVPEGEPQIRPGYINASSWNTGGLSPKEIKHVRASMLVQIRMWDIALDRLNEYNAVLQAWEDIPNPFEDAERLKRANNTIKELSTELQGLKEKGKKKGKGKS